MNSTETDPGDELAAEPGEVRVVKAAEIFGEEKEIAIDHDGIRYRLRITRKNKLILQK